MKYDHKTIEFKWQKKWEQQKLYRAEDKSDKKKFYALIEFPYPSGEGLHCGHPRSYTAMDIIVRKRRMQGYNVLYPIGFDSFGLPAENYALKTGVHPKITTEKNIKKFTQQLKSLGFSFDWDRAFSTTDPDYYKWTQWIFLKLYEKGLAYKTKMPINWCLSCKIGLANEEVVNGKCERCGGDVEKREKEQWMLKITEYADRLIEDLETVDYLSKIKTQQVNWIGRSEGARVKFRVPFKLSVRLGFKTQPNTSNNLTWFLTFSTKGRFEIFENKEESFEIINLLFSSCLKHNFLLHEISVMKDHVHIILETNRDISVEKVFKYLKGYSSKKFQDKFGPYWDNSKGTHIWTPKGNYSIIDDEIKYQEILRYVQDNPEKDGLSRKERLLTENQDKLHVELEVFTTRPDTLFGATYMVLAPEHELIEKLKDKIENWVEAEKYINEAKKKGDLARTDLTKEKIGVELKGIKAVNPVNNEEIPVWIADYVLMGYGTGAIMAVPAHDERDFEFAKKFGLKIKQVVECGDVRLDFCARDASAFGGKTQSNNGAYEGEGVCVNSNFLNGLQTKEAIKKATQWLEEKGLGKKEVNYKLRDWVFSRQRYWGEPIPMVYCEECASAGSAPLSENADINAGWVPVSIEDLPVLLPEVEKYEPTDTGESPLASIKDWVNTKCPKCGGPARRETDTMPNWAGSSWYFLRYIDPKNDKALADQKKLKYWTPIDWYNGGMEHTTLHLLYSRFWHKFLYDIGVAPAPEPYAKRTSHGMVLAEDGEKMSKSRGNVINPDEIIEKYGADTLRMYEMFMGPFGEAIPWSMTSMIGVRRFLERVWELFGEVGSWKLEVRGETDDVVETQNFASNNNDQIERLLHKTIKKVSEDIEEMKFNTAISAMMILVNEATKGAEGAEVTKKDGEIFLKLLAPFAPHIAEELWEKLGHKDSIFKEKWPEYDPELAKDEEIEMVVQINGKVRDKFRVSVDIGEEEAKKMALASEKVKKWLGGKEPKKVVFVKGKLISIVV